MLEADKLLEADKHCCAGSDKGPSIYMIPHCGLMPSPLVLLAAMMRQATT
jgi:hypothetical protein